MHRGLWLRAVPAPVRLTLITSTFVVLGACSFLLGPHAPMGRIAVVVGVVGAQLAIWVITGWMVARPKLARDREALEADAAAWARDRGVLAQAALGPEPDLGGIRALASRDPGFSLPTFLDRAIRVLQNHDGADRLVGPIAIEDVEFDDGQARVAVQAGCRDEEGFNTFVRVVVERPVDTPSPPPHDVTDGGWTVRTTRTLPLLAPPATQPDPGLGASRRALMLRSEAFDLEGFEALITQINALLDRSDATLEEVASYATPRGVQAVDWWRSTGLPSATGPTVWLEVEEDGWYERIEVLCGQRLLGLCRPSGEPEAPWRLWRLRGTP